MSKSTVPQRAKKYADNFRASHDLTIQHAACAGFRAGFEAHKRDVRPALHEPKPTAYVVWAENGNCIMWTTNKAQARVCAERYQRPMRELYDQDVVTGLLAAEEGAAEAFGVVVQDKRDLENEVGRLRALLEGAHATIRSMSALGGYQPVGTTGPVQPPPRKP